MKKMFVVLFAVMTLTACSSGINFEFATSQDHEKCLKETPSHSCDSQKD